MRKWIVVSAAASAAFFALYSIAAPQSGAKAFIGRWDITVSDGKETYPDWMEVTPTDGEVLIRVQPRSGSVHHVDILGIDSGHLKLSLSPAAKDHPAVTWDVTVQGDKLTGVENRGTSTAQLAGVRAPELKRKGPAQWGAPEPLFNGKDLTGWESIGADKSNWIAESGMLVNTNHGANIRTTRKFDDFKLHIEFTCPDDGNSGVYLRGRYEVQIEYEPLSKNDQFHRIGAVYGMIAPAVELPRTPEKWESFDVTLVGRNVTVVRDGTLTIDHMDIPGITGGALDADEAAPGPFYLQGDHRGRLQFRNITVSLPKR
jgi:hypothetical protein